jgi:hypothetical protein
MVQEKQAKKRALLSQFFLNFRKEILSVKPDIRVVLKKKKK